MQRFRPLARQLAETEEGQALLAMVLDDYYYLSTHHGETPIPIPEKGRSHSGGRVAGRSRGRRRR